MVTANNKEAALIMQWFNNDRDRVLNIDQLIGEKFKDFLSPLQVLELELFVNDEFQDSDGTWSMPDDMKLIESYERGFSMSAMDIIKSDCDFKQTGTENGIPVFTLTK